MTEMTPARRAAWQAEEDRKKQAAKDRRKAKTQALKAAVVSDSTVMEIAWLKAYIENPEAGKLAAARVAGYAETSVNTTASRLSRKFAPQIAKSLLDKDALISRVYEAAIGPGVHFVRGESGIDLEATLEKIESADAQWMMTGFKEGKYGPEVTFRNPDVYMKLIADAAGLAAAKVVDVNVLFGKTEEEKEALRQSALQKALALTSQPEDIEGEFTEEGTDDGD